MKNQKNKRKVIVIVVAILVLVLTIGGAYALWTYSKTLGNQTLISGEIFLKYTEGDTVNMKEAMPSVTYNPDEYFEFSVEGKNKYKKDVVFEIFLDEGDTPSGEENKSRTERIKPELLKFRLVEVTTDEEGNEQEEELIQAGSYNDLNKKRIWVDRVKANTTSEIKYTYRLYMWISNDAKIGNMKDADYTAEVWNNNVFASVKVGVNGDFEEKELTEDYLILNAEDSSGEKYDLFQPTGATKDIIVTLASKREITKFVVSKSDQYPIALMSLPEATDYPAEYNPTTRAWEAKVTIEETGIYNYYAEYSLGKNSKTYNFTVLMSPDRYVKVEKPTSALCKQNLTYTGDAQDLIEEENLEQTGYTITQVQGTDADKYQVTAKLDKEYAWADETRNDATFECEIAKKETVLTYEPASSFKVNKGGNKTFKITSTTEGEFTVTSQAEGTATATPKTSSGADTTITVNGVEVGNTKLDINFVPTNKNYTEKAETYDVEVAKAAGAAKLKESLGQTGGIIGIKSDNTKTTSPDDEVREYRYSGLGANNYITFNDEKWRIIGIFKDEDGQEHMKIVRDEVLKRDVFPATYTANGETFNIQYTGSSDYAYWDKPTSGSYYNNWGEAGLMYWLNSLGTTDGYLKTLTSTAQNMIEETKWYLGTVTYLYSSVSSFGIKDTPIEAYNYERAVSGCSGGKGPSANSSQSKVEGNSSCRVWANNAATWNGKIGLMYPSDYGFSADSSYWNTRLLYGSFNGNASNSSWLQKEANHSDYEWLLSPSSYYPGYVAHWGSGGIVLYNIADDGYGVRPVLYLKSDIEVNGGEGTSGSPYILVSGTH